MISEAEIEKLAQLARLALSGEEKASLRKDLESILAYVSELQNAPVGEAMPAETAFVRNVLRPDSNPHETGMFTDDILAQAPKTVNGYFSVKKILG